ncbi:hypothetical protein ACFE04_015122 [Oxalis oulophora]
MTRPLRFLSDATTPPPPPPPDSSTTTPVESDFVVILAALLCALICVLGLIAVARCTWLRRLSSAVNNHPPPQLPPPATANKGVKKKILKSLPKLTYENYSSSSSSASAAVCSAVATTTTTSAAAAMKSTECAICLAEFVSEDEIRVLPQCGHVFHVSCIDTWLGSHSSCPSCRQILVVTRCQKCGGFPVNNPAGGSNSDVRDTNKQGEEEGDHDDDVNKFLP